MKINKKGAIIVILISILLIVNSSLAFSKTIIVNSRDWKDVYSGTQYGILSGSTPKFLVSERHSTLILNEIYDKNVEVLSSSSNPFVTGYENLLNSRGFNATEKKYDTLSIELARRLGTKKFILIDDAYGYNAVSVAPYAVKTKSFVLFATRENINEILDFFEEVNPEEILVYGHVDREVLNGVKPYNPEIINYDGDRFLNNVAIVKKYVGPGGEISQVLLSNGEFIESSLISGQYPVLFIGKQNVPEPVKQFIKDAGVEVGVLVGNDLVGTATIVRRQTGISTFVKFARSAREVEGPIAQIEGLDLFYLPKVYINVTIEAVRYNTLTNQLEITLRNNVDIAVYIKGTHTVRYDGQQQIVGDLETFFIDGQSSKTIVYNLDPINAKGDITAEIFLIYGESKNALEFSMRETWNVQKISLKDESDLQIKKVIFDKRKKVFYIYLFNPSKTDVYAKTEVIDVVIAGQKTTYASDDTILIGPGDEKASKVKSEMIEDDFEDNPVIKVRAYYGQRKDALIKILEGEFKLVVKTFDIMIYLPILIILVLAILVILTVTKKKCPACGKKNMRYKKRCVKCGERI